MSPKYVTTRRLEFLERRLTARDRSIIETLDWLRVATTEQLRRLHFDDLTELSAARQAPRVLRRLSEWRIISQLERQLGGVRAGSRAAVWALDTAGQRLASAAGPAGGRQLRRPWTPGLPFLAHRLAVSELCVQLREAERASTVAVLDFESEPLCWRRYPAPHAGQATLKPDAFARLAIGEFERAAFIEVDRATEARSTLSRKLRTYRHYWEAGGEQVRRGYFPQVIFSVPTEARREVLVELCGAQPPEVWPIFRVVLEEDLTAAVIGEAA